MHWVLFRVRNARITIWLVFALASILSASALAPSRADNPTARIAIAYDIGGRGDNGVNDAVSAGIATAMKRFNLSPLSIREIATLGTEADREARLTFLANAGYNLIIAVGSGYESAMTIVAPTFANLANVQFAIIGSKNVPLLNVTNIDFSENQGAFLAGSLAARISGTGKIGFIAEATSENSTNLKAYTAGAVSVSKKVIVSTTLLSGQANGSGAIKPIVTRMVNSKVDVLYSPWSSTGDVLTSAQALNTAKHPIQLIGLAPVQYFLHAPNAHTVVAAAVTEDFARATVDLISAAIRGNSLSEILDSTAGVYGHRYSLVDGGVGIAFYSRAAIAARSTIVSAESLIRSGKLKL
jgi:basic membrane protein A